MTTNPYITKLPGPGQGQALSTPGLPGFGQQGGPLNLPPPPPGIGQTGPVTPPYQQAQQHFNNVQGNFFDERQDFRSLPKGPERIAARPDFQMQRDYFRDTRDWFNGLPQNASQVPQAPSMPLQIMPTFRGFPGPFPGTQPPLSPRLNPQDRAMARLDQLGLPPKVLERLKAALMGKTTTAPTTPPTTPRHSDPTPKPADPNANLTPDEKNRLGLL